MACSIAGTGCGEVSEDGGEPAAPAGGLDDASGGDEAGARDEALESSLNRYAPGRSAAPIVRQLEAATDGLLFTSESDYPFEVLYWTRPGGAITAERIAALTGHEGEPVEERSLDDFFRAATTVYEGQSPEELATVQRYKDLVKLLRKKLAFVRVYRFGAIQIHSYVVGVTTSGAWAGLATIQIET